MIRNYRGRSSLPTPVGIVIVVQLFALMPLTALAQQIPRSVLASGGARQVGGGLVLSGTVGQTAVGENSSGPHVQQAGFWYLPADVATAVPEAAFQAERMNSGVFVRWMVDTAPPDIAFHVWRQEADEPRIRISEQPIDGASGFEFVDAMAPPGELAYWLQELSDENAWYGPARLSALNLRYELHLNHPNPFNPRTSIPYSLPQTTTVRLTIHDLKGRLVRTLVNHQQPAGRHTVVWNGYDDRGGGVASGIYFARIETGEGVKTRKLQLTR